MHAREPVQREGHDWQTGQVSVFTKDWAWVKALIECDCDVCRALVEFVRRISQGQ